MPKPSPKFRYAVAQIAPDSFSVFVIHDETPLLWRQVAVFASRERADSYATMENDLAQWGADDGAQARADELPVTDILPEPVSGLASVMNRAVIRAGAGETTTIVALPAPDRDAVLQLLEEEPLVVAGPQVPGLLDASTLDPITEKQAAVFKAVCEGAMTFSQIAKRAGVSNASDNCNVLQNKGYIKFDYVANRYVPLASGAPRTATPQNKNSWTPEQLDVLRALCEAGGDFDAFGASIGRTGNACRTQANIRNWYRTWSEARYGKTSEVTRKIPEPAPTEEPVAEPESSPIILGDLNHAQIIVLLTIMQHPEIRTVEIAGRTEYDLERVAKIVIRLEALGLLDADKTGRPILTEHGAKLAKEADAKFTLVAEPAAYTPPAKAVPPPAAAPAGPLDMVAYLEKRGANVSRLGNGMFILNGDRRNKGDVLCLVNTHRRMAELSNLTEGQVF